MTIKLENSRSKTIGQLQSMRYIAVEGAPVKAESFYVVYDLCLKDQIIKGLYSDRFLIHQSLLFVTVLDIEMTQQETGILKGSLLLAMDLNSLKATELSQMNNGLIYAKEIEGDKIVYTKQLLNSSAIKEFDQPINHLIK